MKIETEFNIGDKVYAVTRHGEVKPFEISEIRISATIVGADCDYHSHCVGARDTSTYRDIDDAEHRALSIRKSIRAREKKEELENVKKHVKFLEEKGYKITKGEKNEGKDKI